MRRTMFATKPIAKLLADTENGPNMRRVLGPFDLVALGIGDHSKLGQR